MDLIDCDFINNTAEKNNFGGGAFINYVANATVINCNFTGNYASGSGGAILHYYSSNMSVINCNFYNNTANKGGAIYIIFNSNLNISGSNIINNSDGILVNYENNKVNINNNRIFDNIDYDLLGDRATLTNADNNWWGSNNPDMTKIIGITLNNWYVVDIISVTPLDQVNVKFNYIIKLSTGEAGTPELLPDFEGFEYLNSILSNVFNGKNSQDINVYGNGDLLFQVDNELFNFYLNGKYDSNSTININSNNVKVNDSIIISGKVTDENGNPMGNIVIQVTINGMTYNVNVDGNGNWNLPYKPLNIGLNNVALFWNGTQTFNGFSNTLAFNVNQNVIPSDNPINPNPANPNIPDENTAGFDENNNLDNYTNDNNDLSTANASMKNTGIPLFAILLVLLSSILIFKRKN
jgi:hypothetical protein